MDNSELGARMKELYEKPARTQLLRRMPVAIRIDGKAFHTFTRGFKKPFDRVLMNSMTDTMQYLCENIQGCVFGYTQSDEITLILVDYQTFRTDAWFDYQVQKMTSIAASMATMAFNRSFEMYANSHIGYLDRTGFILTASGEKYADSLRRAMSQGACFDARCFNVPKEEVTNLIYWRQLDATRNSIQMVGQANFSQGRLQHKTCEDIQEMLFQEKGINWNDYSIPEKRGCCCIKVEEKETIKEPNVYFGEQIGERIIVRRKWKIDYEIPIFKGADRDYIDKLIFIEPIA